MKHITRVTLSDEQKAIIDTLVRIKGHDPKILNDCLQTALAEDSLFIKQVDYKMPAKETLQCLVADVQRLTRERGVETLLVEVIPYDPYSEELSQQLSQMEREVVIPDGVRLSHMTRYHPLKDRLPITASIIKTVIYYLFKYGTYNHPLPEKLMQQIKGIHIIAATTYLRVVYDTIPDILGTGYSGSYRPRIDNSKS